MPITLNYETPNTGATAEYHVANIVQLSKDTGITLATVCSYVSKSARDTGKYAMYQQQIQIDGMPDTTDDPFEWAEAQLIQAKPTDGTAVPRPNRYTFAGGELVDIATGDEAAVTIAGSSGGASAPTDDAATGDDAATATDPAADETAA